MKKIVTTVFICFACALTAFAQTNADPNKAKFVTSDIDNFWRAFDLAAQETSSEKKIQIYQTEYLDKGSVGLQDFVRMRIKSAKDLAAVIEILPRFYGSVRPSTLRVRETEKQMRKSFRRFKKIYPNAVFPDVYFVIGVANTGGTASDNGLLIGTELFGLTKNTLRGEFPQFVKKYASGSGGGEMSETDLQQLVDRLLAVALKPIEKVPIIVAHESCHFNQNYQKKETTLLEKSIQEGACDFISELIAGEPLNLEQKIYGNAREAELWREFEAEMNGTDLSKWMYNGFKSKDRPGDLGYYMGYKISWSYYENAKNKRQAVSDVLNIKDFSEFLERSRYREKFVNAKSEKTK